MSLSLWTNAPLFSFEIVEGTYENKYPRKENRNRKKASVDRLNELQPQTVFQPYDRLHFYGIAHE